MKSQVIGFSFMIVLLTALTFAALRGDNLEFEKTLESGYSVKVVSTEVPVTAPSAEAIRACPILALCGTPKRLYTYNFTLQRPNGQKPELLWAEDMGDAGPPWQPIDFHVLGASTDSGAIIIVYKHYGVCEGQIFDLATAHRIMPLAGSTVMSDFEGMGVIASTVDFSGSIKGHNFQLQVGDEQGRKWCFDLATIDGALHWVPHRPASTQATTEPTTVPLPK